MSPELAAVLTEIPSPTRSVWMLGPVPVRAYALCILLGIVVAVWLGEKRYRARGGEPGTVVDIAGWAVPFGIVGGRLYHVATSWEPYFGPGGDPVKALYIWQGGLGIWGAIALGALGVWIGCRRRGLRMAPMADALAPGIVLAQALGRWGNWFNNELYGRATDLPWGLRIYDWDQAAGEALRGATGDPVVLGVYHPTFLYESLWCLGTAGLLLWSDRRFKLGHGQVFALYVLTYTVGRGWIEYLRIDEAHHVLGLRLNDWTSLVVGVCALVTLIVSVKFHPGREKSVSRVEISTEPTDDEPVDDEDSVAESRGPADGAGV